MPPGTDVTVPAALPPIATVRIWGPAENVAVTFRIPSTVTLQLLPFVASQPVQLAAEPFAGAAVSVIVEL